MQCSAEDVDNDDDNVVHVVRSTRSTYCISTKQCSAEGSPRQPARRRAPSGKITRRQVGHSRACTKVISSKLDARQPLFRTTAARFVRKRGWTRNQGTDFAHFVFKTNMINNSPTSQLGGFVKLFPLVKLLFPRVENFPYKGRSGA